ncbi:ATP-binding cassette domain-containing protein [Thermomonospora umbrina]|uniref:Phosphate transport system ATP-binding protein n=1 Tax=Thermomonospora umbrina TaxID=111806 RepID=A0A3D9SWM9_9ACTN|nr:ATP-binding cassette domain-containing protein [Thermomonospora umbrina]REE99997.1 phosphate transport system ATP-binding protein [Thermomonospora umbrina]
MNAAEVRDLTIRTAQRPLVGPVSFTLPLGESMGLCGPSGAGKSTVLRALVGLLPETLQAAGEVRVLDIDVTAQSPAALSDLRARAVLVPQVPIVFPGGILANVLFGIRHVVRAPRGKLRKRAESALVEVGLWNEVAERLDAPAGDLSVGQRQRLALARALALDPQLILLDEPTSSLDGASAAEVEATLQSLRGRRTMILVSHDMNQVERLCSTTVAIGAGHQGAAAGAQSML